MLSRPVYKYHFRLSLMLWLLVSWVGQYVFADEPVVTLLAAGDVQWSKWPANDEAAGNGQVFYDVGETPLLEGGWQPLPRLISEDTMAILEKKSPKFMRRFKHEIESEFGFPLEKVSTYYTGLKRHQLTFESDTEWANYPFQKVTDIFRKADIAFVNLENPLSDDAPKVGMLRAPTVLSNGLANAGIDVVSIANNHMMDAQIWGLYDTMSSLDKAGVKYIGAGKNLSQAREPYIVEKRGIKIAFLAYTQYENNGPLGFATPAHAGVMPLDPLVIKADIKRIRSQVDQIIVSFHWDIFSFDPPKQFDLHPDAVAFAHDIIDAGADAILGHGPHVPRAVEYYKNKPILYSMGHLILSFGDLPIWVDNYVARLNITKSAIPSVEIMPVAGKLKDQDLSQPYFLSGQRAQSMLEHLQQLSSNMGGKLIVEGNRGILTADNEDNL